ncbi:MAG: hypothetical protein KDN19_19405 [Verrucomicrobiae bacterium]|nr:hypothetical protein [Verrucomicrobiae bacterium]
MLSASVILLWLVSTGWLVRTTWFSSETRFDPVAPEEALDAFFKWSDRTTLAVLENGRRIGRMEVSGSEGREPRTGGYSRVLSTQGTLDVDDRDTKVGTRPGLNGTTWRLAAEFDQEMELQKFRLVFRIPKQELDLRMELKGEPPQIAARASVGGLVIYEAGKMSMDEDGNVIDEARDDQAGTATAPSLPPSAALGWLPGGALLNDRETWKPKIEASRGMMRVAGSNQPIYLVKLRFGDDESVAPIRLYLSETGEPWRIDTGWGFEAVAEVLVPVEDQAR